MKTQYAIPVQTSVEKITETKPTLISRTNKSETNKSGTRSTIIKPKPPRVDTTNVNTTQTRTKSRIRFPDGSYSDWIPGEWTEQ